MKPDGIFELHRIFNLGPGELLLSGFIISGEIRKNLFLEIIHKNKAIYKPILGIDDDVRMIENRKLIGFVIACSDEELDMVNASKQTEMKLVSQKKSE